MLTFCALAQQICRPLFFGVHWRFVLSTFIGLAVLWWLHLLHWRGIFGDLLVQIYRCDQLVIIGPT